MSTPRRRLVRPPPVPARPDPDHQRQLQKVRTRLEQERAAFARWMPRLKRAFHTVMKAQQRIARLERQLAQLEE